MFLKSTQCWPHCLSGSTLSLCFPYSCASSMRDFCISVAMSRESGPSLMTQPSSVDWTVSLHTGQVLWFTFHCSMQGRQYEWAQGRITSGFLSMQTQHSSREVQARASSRNLEAENLATVRGWGSSLLARGFSNWSSSAGEEGSELSGVEWSSDLLAAVCVCSDLNTARNCLSVNRR